MKLIGKGTFTKAYLMDTGKVFLRSDCWAKEALALFPVAGELFPRLEKTGCGEYVMDYYQKTKSLKNYLKVEEYNFYVILRHIFSAHAGKGYRYWHKIFADAYFKYEGMYKSKFFELCEYLDTLANYDDESICFEISPRNVRSVDGKLLLLDCFFFRNQLNEIQSKRLLKYVLLN